MTVEVSFDYEPEEPDETDPTGLSVDEHDRLMEQLIEIGATNIKVEPKGRA